MMNPVIRRFGLKASGLSGFLLTEHEMIKHNFPVKGNTQHTHTHVNDTNTHTREVQPAHFCSHDALQVGVASRVSCALGATGR